MANVAGAGFDAHVVQRLRTSRRRDLSRPLALYVVPDPELLPLQADGGEGVGGRTAGLQQPAAVGRRGHLQVQRRRHPAVARGGCRRWHARPVADSSGALLASAFSGSTTCSTAASTASVTSCRSAAAASVSNRRPRWVSRSMANRWAIRRSSSRSCARRSASL